MAQAEIKSLTGIRGLASIYVVIFHCVGYYTSTHPLHINTFVNNFFEHGYIGVDIFFVLSGLVLCISSKKYFSESFRLIDYRDFMIKRFCRIFPIYISLTVIYYLILNLHQTKLLLLNLTLFQCFSAQHSVIDPAWSLSVEWVNYFLFPLLLFAVLRLKLRKEILIALLFSGAIVLLLFIANNFSSFLNGRNFVKFNAESDKWEWLTNRTSGYAAIIRCFACYLLGIAAFFLNERLRVKNNFLAVVICGVILLMLFFTKSDVLFLLSLPFFFCILMNKNIISNIVSSAPVYFLGQISYSLYLVHIIIIWKALSFFHIYSLPMQIIFTFLTSVVLAAVCYYLIEKKANKGLRYLLLYKKSIGE